MAGALLTDLYELNMAASYLRREMTEPATFSLFVRSLPPQRGFLVAAGLEEALAFLERLSFEEEDLEYVRSELGFDESAVEAFRRFRFEGDVWAVPEGRVVYANEPLLEVTAPLPQAQLVETALLNIVTLHTTIASKAARCVIAAGDRDLVDFALRRTQGFDAAMAVARCTAMVGFVATSNVEAARTLGLTAAGTMAHSYVEAFEREADAFRAFAEDHPGRTTFLVDTYDTTEGVRAAIRVIRDLGLTGRLGVRLDSGDLESLSRRTREILDEAGLPEVRIFASGGLDETDIEQLARVGTPIDAFGVGTRMGVSADAPSLDTVYKLVRYADRPVMKLSADKVTAPGEKQVFRREDGDVIGLREESTAPGMESLLVPVMAGGRRIGDLGGIAEARERFRAELPRLPEPARRISDPKAPEASVSEALKHLVETARAALARPD